jgi:hypothetical protein
VNDAGAPRPVSFLRWASGDAPIDTGSARGEVVLDARRRVDRWRLWTRVADGRWRPGEWRYPSRWEQRVQKTATSGGAA